MARDLSLMSNEELLIYHDEISSKMSSISIPNLGARRKALIARSGYDTKAASHLIRLLRMGIEFLKDGQLYVMREDAKQLLEIKRGEWTLEQVKAEAEREFQVVEQAYLASTLTAGPDMEAVGRLAVDVVSLAMRESV